MNLAVEESLQSLGHSMCNNVLVSINQNVFCCHEMFGNNEKRKKSVQAKVQRVHIPKWKLNKICTFLNNTDGENGFIDKFW